MTAEPVRSVVEAILRDQLRIKVPSPETDLLDSGLLDSLGLVDLIVAIERAFDIVVNLIDLDLDDVRTADSICRLVEARVAAELAAPAPLRLVTSTPPPGGSWTKRAAADG